VLHYNAAYLAKDVDIPDESLHIGARFSRWGEDLAWRPPTNVSRRDVLTQQGLWRLRPCDQLLAVRQCMPIRRIPPTVSSTCILQG
jgi:hypothetical protein